MGIFKKVVAGVTVLTAIGSAAFYYDVQRMQVYKCQPFGEAVKQYFTISNWKALGSAHSKKLEAACKDVCKTQEEFLMRQLKENSCTEYGKLYNFGEMCNVCEFKRCHPLTRYDHYRPYIERMMCGESNILTKENPCLFATTANTSNCRKIIPVLKRQKDIFTNDGLAVCLNSMVECLDCNNREKLYKDFYLFHSPCWKTCKAGVKLGPDALSQEEMTDLLHMFTSPQPLLSLKQEPEAMYVHMLFALQDCQLAIMHANFANTLFYAFKMLEWERPCFVTDIQNGTLNCKLDIRCDIRRCLETMLKSDCDRARMIEEAFCCGPEGLAARLWPNLQVAMCIDSGPAYSMYGEQLRNTFLKGVHVYSPYYFAAEGLMGVNIWPRNLPTRYMLHPRAMFFELIPYHRMKEDQPETCAINEAQTGQMYEVVITNASGLYRYRMGDVVKVCGFHHEAPIVEFMYRESQNLKSGGEDMNENLVYNAVSSVVKEWDDFQMVDYICVPSSYVKAISNQIKDPKIKEKFNVDHNCYYLFMEPPNTFTVPRVDQVQRLDSCLTEKCPAYGQLRQQGSLKEVKLQLVHPKTFVQLKDVMNEVNFTTSDQFKVPRVTTSPEAVELLMCRSM